MRFEISAATRAGTTSISAADRAGRFERLHVLIDALRFGGRPADRLEAAGPGRPRRDEADMADDGNAFGGKPGDRVQARSAIEGVAAGHQSGMGGAQVVLIGAVLTVDETDLDETVARRLAHLGRPQGLDDREDVDARRGGGRRLVQRLDEQHRQLPLALQRPQIADRHPPVLAHSHLAPLRALLGRCFLALGAPCGEMISPQPTPRSSGPVDTGRILCIIE